MYELHRGAFFGIAGRIVMLLTSLTMPLFTVTGILLYLARRRRKRAGQDFATMPAVLADNPGSDLLVAYASQTGGAELLAHRTAAAFGAARVLPLASVDAAVLSDVKRALFIVSTYGDGEAPDTARRFARATMAAPLETDHLEYAVLARGDREYPEFCAFGHRLDHWLHAGGGRRLFDMVEMDGEDADAHRHWQQQLVAIGAASDQPDWTPAAYERWRLVERQLLNPGSAGGLAFLIALEPVDSPLAWEAGDIVEIAPRHGPAAVDAFLQQAGLDGVAPVEDGTMAELLAQSILPEPSATADPAWTERLHPLAHREYSIASVPADGRLELVVRQHVSPDGTLGLGSGWLTAHAPLGAEIALRVQANPGFRLSEEAGENAMILIGNGTGIAGLRAHLHRADRAGSKGHWLLFGERNRAHDALFDAELRQWQGSGVLHRLDRAFSRDADCGRYVQHLVAAAADEIRVLVNRGATILVCGSLQGMAPDADAALRQALGDTLLETMAEQGRYRRDVY